MKREKKIRHKWKKKINHSYCHQYICEKCGCEKDNTSMNNSVYYLNGIRYSFSPSCIQQEINSIK